MEIVVIVVVVVVVVVAVVAVVVVAEEEVVVVVVAVVLVVGILVLLVVVVVVVVVISTMAQILPSSRAAPSSMQWMWKCCLRVVLLIATCEKGQSEGVAMPAMTVCNQVGSVKQSIVFGRVDGQAIPWFQQLQPKPTWKSSRYSWAYMGSALKRSGNWAYGFISNLTKLVIQGSAQRLGPSWTQSWRKLTCTNICRFFRTMLPEDALSDMRKMLHQLVLTKAHAKRVAEAQQATEASTCRESPNISIDDLQELYASFLEQYAEHTCRVVERRMRCIQLKQDLQEANGTECYPRILYRSLWRNEQGAWSQFLHERDLEDMWLPM